MRETGTRADLIADLASVAEGCLGSDGLRAEAAAAVDALAAGASSVRVGHTEHVVTDTD